METFRGRVRLVIKNYPYKYRDYSHMAAEASLAALDQGKYWEMHDILLKNSPKLDRDSLLKYAKEIGLNMRAFSDALEKMKHAGLIERDKKLAVALDLYSTPTFFVNGRKVVGDVPYDFLKKVVEEELKDAKK